MAFSDTPYLNDAFRKANNANATHYYVVSDAQDRSLSYTFIKGDKPDKNGLYQEVASWSPAMESFNKLSRLIPESILDRHMIDKDCLGQRYNGGFVTRLIEIDKFYTESRLVSAPVESMSCCK